MARHTDTLQDASSPADALVKKGASVFILGTLIREIPRTDHLPKMVAVLVPGFDGTWQRIQVPIEAVALP